MLSIVFAEVPFPGVLGRRRVKVNQFSNSEAAYTRLLMPIMMNAVERTPIG